MGKSPLIRWIIPCHNLSHEIPKSHKKLRLLQRVVF